MSSMITSSRRPTGPHKPGRKGNDNNTIYANPLPLLFLPLEKPVLQSVIGLLGLSIVLTVNPHCEGILDVATRSVWVTNSKDAMILWRRGFFGKGDLSRSEPSWLARQVNARKMAGKQLTSEEITAKRRAERKQFKLDRAAAIAAAAVEAETAFAEGRDFEPERTPDGARASIPSAATWRPAKKEPVIKEEREDGAEEVPVEEEEPLEDVEHLQLTLQEAFFMAWNLDCLTIIDPKTSEALTLKQIWLVFQCAHLNLLLPPLVSQPLQFDNPFLINYVVYHHYRSLGWVVKGGIKFCVDYLLYKRGPVFAHAEIALVVCPVYEDPEDQEASLFDLQNASPFSWSWLSTLNRVNSQVQKTLTLVYVTIPARYRVSPNVLSSPACFTQYSIREVTVRRFIPARMRD